jgi:hypothetical protein
MVMVVMMVVAMVMDHVMMMVVVMHHGLRRSRFGRRSRRSFRLGHDRRESQS